MGFHYFAFAGAFVVNSAQVQNPVYYNPVQFLIVCSSHLFGIGSYGVYRYEHVAVYGAASAVVERYNVCIIIVLQKLPVYFQNALVVTKNIVQVPYPASVAQGNLVYPGAG